jgi:OOP family OmpA-OmpF porin
LWAALCQRTGAETEQKSSSCLGPPLPAKTGSASLTGPEDPAVEVRLPEEKRGRNLIEVTIPADMLFAIDSYQLSDVARATLSTLTSRYAETAASVVVVGRTDSRGKADYNQALSMRRAQVVADYLGSAGFPNVIADGVGESQPVCVEIRGNVEDVNCMARNRRVDIRITTKVAP